MFVARFQNKNGLILKEVSHEFVESLKGHRPNGTPVEHPYGGCLVAWRVPEEWECEAIWRAKTGWLKEHCVWEYHGVGLTPAY